MHLYKGVYQPQPSTPGSQESKSGHALWMEEMAYSLSLSVSPVFFLLSITATLKICVHLWAHVSVSAFLWVYCAALWCCMSIKLEKMRWLLSRVFEKAFVSLHPLGRCRMKGECVHMEWDLIYTVFGLFGWDEVELQLVFTSYDNFYRRYECECDPGQTLCKILTQFTLEKSQTALYLVTLCILLILTSVIYVI